MLIKGITDEDFINYKVPSMYIATATCSFKCDKEYGQPICQNSALATQPSFDVPVSVIVDRYLTNPITHGIVLGGLEPLDQFGDVIDLIRGLRTVPDPDMPSFALLHRDHPKAMDPVVIYTGYTVDELDDVYSDWCCDCDPRNLAPVSMIDLFKNFGNIILKFGRYIPGQQPHFDPVLGVNLASDNQYAERIS